MKLTKNQLTKIIRQQLNEANLDYAIDSTEEAKEFATFLMMKYEKYAADKNITRKDLSSEKKLTALMKSSKLKKAWNTYGSDFIRKKKSRLGIGAFGIGKKGREFLGGKEQVEKFKSDLKAPTSKTPAVIFTTKLSKIPGRDDKIMQSFARKKYGTAAARTIMRGIKLAIPEGHGGVIHFNRPDKNGYSYPTSFEFGRYGHGFSRKGSCRDLSTDLASGWIDNLADGIGSVYKTVTGQKKEFFPIASKSEGNQFRRWVNDNHPDLAVAKTDEDVVFGLFRKKVKGLDLDPAGAYNNANVKQAWKLLGKEYMKHLKDEDEVLHREYKRRKYRENVNPQRDAMYKRDKKGKYIRTKDKKLIRKGIATVGLVAVGHTVIKDHKSYRVKLVPSENGEYYEFEDMAAAMKKVRAIFRTRLGDRGYRETRDAPPYVIVNGCDIRKAREYATKGDQCMPYLVIPGTILRTLNQILTTSREGFENCGSFAMNVIRASKGRAPMTFYNRPIVFSTPEQMGYLTMLQFPKDSINPDVELYQDERFKGTREYTGGYMSDFES